MRRVAVLFALAAVLTGCSEKADGRPTAGDTPTSTKAPASSSKAAASRPKTLNMKGVDACGVLTDAQKKEFGLTGNPTKAPKSSVYPNTEGCSITAGDRSDGVLIFATDTAGVERFTNGSVNGEVKQITVSGFPAYQNFIDKKPLDHACTIAVDVADGQIVEIFLDNEKEAPQPQVCDKAVKIAEAAVATLAAR